MMSLPDRCTVLVIGSGNAGLSAAISAAQNRAESVLLVDKCTHLPTRCWFLSIVVEDEQNRSCGQEL